MKKLFLVLVAILLSTPVFAQYGQVWPDLLGNPTRDKFPDDDPCVFARNIWTLQPNGSKVYVGHGNAANADPCLNAGTSHGGIDIWQWNFSTFTFVNEFTVQEESIDRYKFGGNGVPTVPGRDAIEDWQYGNFYTLETNGWLKHRTIPGGIHEFDIISPNGMLYAAGSNLGDGPGGGMSGTLRSSLQVSFNAGNTWVDALCDGVMCPTLNRMYRFFAYGGSQYVTQEYLENIDPNHPPLHLHQNDIYRLVSGRDWTKLDRSVGLAMFPGLYRSVMKRSLNFLTGNVYMEIADGDGAVGADPHPGFADSPQNLIMYMSGTIGTNVQIMMPPAQANSIMRDITVINGKLFAVQSIDLGAGTMKNVVSFTIDGVTWTEMLWFYSTVGFVRSFAYSNGYWFFGMGCKPDMLSNISGDISIFYAPVY